MNGYLLVRSNGRPYGLPLDDVIEVVDSVESSPLPGASPAVRGVVRIRDHVLTVVHLAALLTGDAIPDEASTTVVVARCADRRIALEVEDAEEVVRDDPLPVPEGRRLPWASGIAERHETLIPIVNLEVVGEKLAVEHAGAAE